MIFTCEIETPLGNMTAAAKSSDLIGLWFVGQKYYPARKTDWVSQPDNPVFESLRSYLQAYFAGEPCEFGLTLAAQGSRFQKTVWDALLRIPIGQVATYGEIARLIAKSYGIASMSAQAVGGAIGRNPISIIIPCHRVIGSNGALTGYAGGLERKAALLNIEKANLPTTRVRR